MKILGIADIEAASLWDYYSPDKTKDTDLIISCGDLNPDYLQFLVTMTNKKLLYVYGNHDIQYEANSPLGCVNIDGRVYEYNGIRILGLGGCMKYKPSSLMYTEGEMKRRIMKVTPQIVLMGGIDILVTHAPAAGYGDLEDMPHWGYKCFNELINRWKPKLMLHGHVHQNYSASFKRTMLHEAGAQIHNCYSHCTIDFDDSSVTNADRSLFYSLYSSLRKQED